MSHCRILRNSRLLHHYFPVINLNFRQFTSIKSPPKRIRRLTLIGASVGVSVGVGYSGYSQYQIKNNYTANLGETVQPHLLKEQPNIQPTRKVLISGDMSNLRLVLFQHQTCPFCCKVRAFLDYNGISYDVVEVDAVLRQTLKWSTYKKVPILLTETSDGYQQLNDSSVIISALKTYLNNKNDDISTVLTYYPTVRYKDSKGNTKDEIANKYHVMKMNEVFDELMNVKENEERKWREWADNVLVHTLSPNVYRTLEEAFQAFNWFAEVGMWHENFPRWEVLLMVNMGAVAMWMISKRLKQKYNIKDDARESLYDDCNQWMRSLKKKNTPFMGGDSPNLADLAAYGVLSSIEGCKAFADAREHTSIGKWYDQMKDCVVNHRGLIVNH